MVGPGAASPLSRRQQKMATLIISDGPQRVADLAVRLGVSQMTAYRDIDRLTELGILRRTRHGITAQPSSIFESSLEYRSHVFPREKEAISAACLELVEPGMSLIIDDGTTLIPLVERLGERVPLTVITSFVRVIGELSKVAGIDLIVVGGSYRRRYESLSGVLCADMISQLRADILFLSPSAVHQGTALHQDEDMVATKRAMIESSEQRVLVADHSKLGRRATHRLGDVSDFDVVITDDNADQSQLSHVSDYDTPVTVAAVQPVSGHRDQPGAGD